MIWLVTWYWFLAPVFGVEELDVGGRAVVAGELHAVTQRLGTVEDVALVEVVEDFGKFAQRLATGSLWFSSCRLRLA